jgi:hypothetical protein
MLLRAHAVARRVGAGWVRESAQPRLYRVLASGRALVCCTFERVPGLLHNMQALAPGPTPLLRVAAQQRRAARVTTPRRVPVCTASSRNGDGRALFGATAAALMLLSPVRWECVCRLHPRTIASGDPNASVPRHQSQPPKDPALFSRPRRCTAGELPRRGMGVDM